MIKSEITAYIMYLALENGSFTSEEVCNAFSIQKKTRKNSLGHYLQ